MFFRRPKPRTPTFADRLESLQHAGFVVKPEGTGKATATKNGCAVTLADNGTPEPALTRAGIVIGAETGRLVDGGFQKFFETPSGVRQPALAPQLRALHDFQEDLKEALGLTSLYNESLGTTSNAHLYDRVKDRDKGVPKRPWDGRE